MTAPTSLQVSGARAKKQRPISCLPIRNGDSNSWAGVTTCGCGKTAPKAGDYDYWGFEADAADLLMVIVEDSILQQYLYYPNDLVAWVRAQHQLGDRSRWQQRPALQGGQPCARADFWRAPARAASRQHFELRQVMPGIGSAWGATIWQLDEQP